MNTTKREGNGMHGTNLIRSVDEKYKIQESTPRAVKSDKLLPKCSNSYLFQLIKTWDKGNRAVRERILQEFVASNQHATGPQLERELNNGASLFLTRISAWLRMTYLLGHDLALQLRAITVFIASASGNRFLTEFLEVGGILTVLEILTINQAKEMDRAEALNLLIKVSSNGRKYKEFICESYGVRQVTECLSRSRSEITQDYARNMMVQLGTGNPKFQMQVFKGLQSLLSSPAISPTSQQMAAQALRILLTSTANVPATLIDPAASLLRSQHMQVQYEGYELLLELVQRPNCQEPIMIILVAILRNVFETNTDESERHRGKDKPATITQWAGLSSEDQKEKERLTAGYVQQAYAAKLVGILIASSDEIAEKLIQYQVVSALLNVTANITHPESQKYATSNLIHLVDRFDYVAQALRDNMGSNFFDLLETKPDTFYRELNKEQIRYLRRNKIKIHSFNEAEKVINSDSESDSDEEGHKQKQHIHAFPSSMPKEEATKEVVEDTTVKQTQQSTVENDAKLQQQKILDSYEQNETAKAKVLMEDMYSPYQRGGNGPSFPGNKYAEQSGHVEKMQFESDLERFRVNNQVRRDLKTVFEPEFAPDTSKRMENIRNDTQLFSHEKMIKTIDQHLVATGVKTLISTEDQAMLMFGSDLQATNEDAESTDSESDILEDGSVHDLHEEHDEGLHDSEAALALKQFKESRGTAEADAATGTCTLKLKNRWTG
ncbi:armadillo-type protein [Globomyces pollinis-pini]|nr:armadillo-type protein [Globomyces pollinis-pini]